LAETARSYALSVAEVNFAANVDYDDEVMTADDAAVPRYYSTTAPWTLIHLYPRPSRQGGTSTDLWTY